MRQTLKENHLLWEMRKIDIFSHPSTRTTKWSPIRLILVTYQPETSWVISTRAKHKPETLTEGPQTVIVVFAMRSVNALSDGALFCLPWGRRNSFIYARHICIGVIGALRLTIHISLDLSNGESILLILDFGSFTIGARKCPKRASLYLTLLRWQMHDQSASNEPSTAIPSALRAKL